MVPPTGFEPATPRLGIWCSIQAELRGHRTPRRDGQLRSVSDSAQGKTPAPPPPARARPGRNSSSTRNRKPATVAPASRTSCAAAARCRRWPAGHRRSHASRRREGCPGALRWWPCRTPGRSVTARVAAGSLPALRTRASGSSRARRQRPAEHEARATRWRRAGRKAACASSSLQAVDGGLERGRILAAPGVMSLNRMPGLGKSGTSRITCPAVHRAGFSMGFRAGAPRSRRSGATALLSAATPRAGAALRCRPRAGRLPDDVAPQDDLPGLRR